MVTLVQLLFWAICLGTARYQAYRFDVLQKGISHTLWAIYYGAACALVWYFTRNTLLTAAIVVMRLPVFTTALNFWRIPRRPIFYTNWEANGGSKWDDAWKDAYPAMFFLTSIAYVVLQFYIYG